LIYAKAREKFYELELIANKMEKFKETLDHKDYEIEIDNEFAEALSDFKSIKSIIY
jgi:hypothetical protein